MDGQGGLPQHSKNYAGELAPRVTKRGTARGFPSFGNLAYITKDPVNFNSLRLVVSRIESDSNAKQTNPVGSRNHHHRRFEAEPHDNLFCHPSLSSSCLTVADAWARPL